MKKGDLHLEGEKIYFLGIHIGNIFENNHNSAQFKFIDFLKYLEKYGDEECPNCDSGQSFVECPGCGDTIYTI